MPTLLLRGETIGTIQGVLFDKDGTLSNSERHLSNLAKLRIKETTKLFIDQGASVNVVSKIQELLPIAYGLTSQGLSPNGTIAVGSRQNNIISTATIFCLVGETWPKALELSKKIFEIVDKLDGGVANSAEQRMLLPGVLTTLQNLRDANITCAVISNDSRPGIQSFLSTNNLRDFFSNFWSADHHPPKPDPAAVQKLCKNIQIQPSDCALIGDADSDLQMARQSGIGITLGYTGGWSKKPQLTQHQHLIHNWDELTIQ